MNNEAKPVYVGNAKKIGENGLSIELNLTQLKAFVNSPEGLELVRKFNSKQGEQSTIKLAVWPLKEPGQFRTHSVKIDTWKPNQQNEESKPVEQPPKTDGEHELPF